MRRKADIIDKPWGHEEIWAQSSRYAGKILVINKGHRLSRQYHNVKEETIMVLEGTLVCEEGPTEVGGEIKLDMFEAGEFDVCTLYYSEFKSVISQIPTGLQLIPAKFEDEEDVHFCC